MFFGGETSGGGKSYGAGGSSVFVYTRLPDLHDGALSP